MAHKVRIHFPLPISAPVREYSLDIDSTFLPREGESLYLEEEITAVGKTFKISHEYDVTRVHHCHVRGQTTHMVWLTTESF